jgi:hypothetical protein
MRSRSAAEQLRPVAPLARLARRPDQVCRRRHRLRHPIRHHLEQLTGASHLGFDEGAGPRTDMARRTLHSCVRPRLMRHELRLHRGVAHLAAKGVRLHRVHAAVGGQRHDQQVDDGEDEHPQRDGALMRLAKVNDRPIGGPLRMQAPPARAPPPADRHEQQTDDEEQRDGDEDQQPDVRVWQVAGEMKDGKNEKDDGHRRGDGHPHQGDRIPDPVRQLRRQAHEVARSVTTWLSDCAGT